jgi:murein DD-endopeptidase MepM/ murein hydrolase activator NlpD
VKLVAAFAVLLVMLALLFAGGFTAFTGTLMMDAQDPSNAIPPELEAAYRQVGYRTGVHWAALAAWDGAENHFAIQIPTVDEIYAAKIQAELERRRRQAEAWCQAHPKDAACPPDPPELSPADEHRLWMNAYAEWRARLNQYVEGHAAALASDLEAFSQDPEGVYRKFLGSATAARAAELFEGYQLLDELQEDADESLVDPTEPPPNWTPVDGFAWPAVAPITSRFGMRVSPIDGQRRLHAGVDLGVVLGTPIRASKAGKVVQAETDSIYGLMVVINHGDGYSTLYAHNSALDVSVGQRVEQGQTISQSGSTGKSTGPHLHFEIHYRGTPVDPLMWLSP